MQSIRVLTGRHAGSQLKLRQHHQRIGHQADCDVHISDWQGEPLEILCREGQDACLLPSPKGVTADPGAQPVAQLRRFIPVRVGGIVLCAGPQEGEWPADAVLLAQVAPCPSRRAGLRKTLWMLAAGLAVLLAPCALIVRAHSTARVDPRPPAALPVSHQVQAALARVGLADLRVREADAFVVVEGVLPDASSVAMARGALQRFGSVVVHRYASAVALGQSIHEALGEPTVSISHEGQGAFKASGRVLIPARAAEAAKRIEQDLSPLVTRIDLALEEAPAPSRFKIGAKLSGSDVSYVQTSDGVKHLTLQQLPPTAQLLTSVQKEARP